MRVTCYIPTWNEERILPFTISHYKEICDEIVIVDNHSTDKTVDIARSLNCDVMTFGTPGVFDDQELIDCKNNIWKMELGQSDWVIVCDADELLMITRDDLLHESARGNTIIQTQGYNMHSNDWPLMRLTELTNGIQSKLYSKRVAFMPSYVSNIGYRHGAHICFPSGVVMYSDYKYPLLHYKFVGGVERVIQRHQECAKRMSRFNLDNGLSKHYLQPEEDLRLNWDRWLKEAKQVIRPH